MFKRLVESEYTRPDQMKLSRISDPCEFEPDIQKALKDLLALKKLNLTIAAVVMNAALTQNKGTFLFSRTILEDLMHQSKELKITSRATLSGDDFKEFMTWSRNNDFLDLILSGTKIGEASVVEIIDNEFQQLLSRKVSAEFLAAQKARCIELHRTSLEPSKGTSKETSKESSSELTEVTEYNEVTEVAVQLVSDVDTAKTSPYKATSFNKEVNPEHKKLLEECLKVAPKNKFLVGKADALSKYGFFTENQISTLKSILSKSRTPKDTATAATPSSVAPLQKPTLKPVHGGLLNKLLDRLNPDTIASVLNEYDWTPALVKAKDKDCTAMMDIVLRNLSLYCPEQALSTIKQIDALKSEPIPGRKIDILNFRIERRLHTANICDSLNSDMTDDQLLALFNMNTKADSTDCESKIRNTFDHKRKGSVLDLYSQSRQSTANAV